MGPGGAVWGKKNQIKKSHETVPLIYALAVHHAFFPNGRQIIFNSSSLYKCPQLLNFKAMI